MTANAIVTMLILMGIFFGGFTIMMRRLLKMEKMHAEIEVKETTVRKGA